MCSSSHVVSARGRGESMVACISQGCLASKLFLLDQSRLFRVFSNGYQKKKRFRTYVELGLGIIQQTADMSSLLLKLADGDGQSIRGMACEGAQYFSVYDFVTKACKYGNPGSGVNRRQALFQALPVFLVV